MWQLHFEHKIEAKKRVASAFRTKSEEFIRSNACAANWFHFAFDRSHQCRHYVWERDLFTGYFFGFVIYTLRLLFIHSQDAVTQARHAFRMRARTHTQTKKCVSCTNSQIEKTCTQHFGVKLLMMGQSVLQSVFQHARDASIASKRTNIKKREMPAKKK